MATKKRRPCHNNDSFTYSKHTSRTPAARRSPRRATRPCPRFMRSHSTRGAPPLFLEKHGPYSFLMSMPAMGSKSSPVNAEDCMPPPQHTAMVPTFSVLRFRFLLARVGIGSTCKPPTRCWRRWVALICVKRSRSLSACRGSHAAHGALFHTASGRPFLCNLRVKETPRRAPEAEGTEEWIKQPHSDTRVIIRAALAFVLSVAVARQWGRAAVEPRRAHGFVDAVLPVLPLLPGLNGHRWHGWAASSAAGRARLARHACSSRGSERRHCRW